MSEGTPRFGLGLLFDRKQGGPTPAAWGLVGLVLAIVGLSIFAVDVVAFLGGARNVTVTRPRSVSTFPIVPHALFGLFLGTCGVATLWRGLTLTFPSLAARSWFLWVARLVLLPLVLLLFALTALALARWAGLLDV